MFISDKSNPDSRYLLSLIHKMKAKRENMDLEELARVTADYYRTKLAASHPKLDEAVRDTVWYVANSWFIDPFMDNISERLLSMAEDNEKVQKIFLEQPHLKEEIERYWATHPLTPRQSADYWGFICEQLRPLVRQTLESQFTFESKNLGRRWLPSFLFHNRFFR